MTAERTPLKAWRYPEQSVLRGNVFPSSKPPFAPFPSVTNLLNACLCPVASLHDMLHGDETALLGAYPTIGRGELFHQFISNTKLSLRGDLDPFEGGRGTLQEGVFRNRFLEFAQKRGRGLSEASDIWQESVEPWVRRKLLAGELNPEQKKGTLFFEITVANPKVSFNLGDGMRHYPLYGRIDEIDLEKRKIIERTTKPGTADGPPLLKDLQVWLLWKVLSSLSKDQLPAPWKSQDFKSYDLVVETPQEDYSVEREAPDSLLRAHWAYAWINDISISESPGVAREVYQNAACTPEFPHSECSHPFRNCFTRNFPYPQSRPEVQRVFRPWKRLLLWERMWVGDLWYYQLWMTPRPELVDRGFLSEASILSTAKNQAEVAIIRGERISARGYDRFTLIPFGTLFCGLWANASLVSMRDGRLILELQDSAGVWAGEALLLPTRTETSAPIMAPPPDYLVSIEQRALARVERAGVVKEDKATKSSVVQLLESLFGARRLQRRAR